MEYMRSRSGEPSSRMVAGVYFDVSWRKFCEYLECWSMWCMLTPCSSFVWKEVSESLMHWICCLVHCVWFGRVCTTVVSLVLHLDGLQSHMWMLLHASDRHKWHFLWHVHRMCHGMFHLLHGSHVILTSCEASMAKYLTMPKHEGYIEASFTYKTYC